MRALKHILTVGFQNMAISVILYSYGSDTSCNIPPLSMGG
jgi:hypothetical protein